MTNQKKAYVIISLLAAIVPMTIWAAGNNCAIDVPTNCQNPTTNVVERCTAITSASPYTLCATGADAGKESCGNPANYNCVFTVTYSTTTGFYIKCPKAGQTDTVTNVVSQTLATGATCPGGA